PVTPREPVKLVEQRSVPVAVKARVVLPKPQATRLPHRAHSRTQIRRTQEPDPSVVVVERGDSLWRIAEDLFGDGRLWTALWHANPDVSNPNRIYVGQTLRVPAPAQLAQLRLKLHKSAAHARTAIPAPAPAASAAHAAPASAAQLQAPAQPASNPRR
ncbi:MAG TPA: LysM peptidoglycan-binding domain-containing protein, partial [Terriglobales bacterium]|nr:LysM peptidoglycan-binding domain-containing protein [Terriglobales bacterium]